MKVIFVNRFFHPDSSATSQMVSDLAFHLAAKGHEVHVIAARVPGTVGSEAVRGVRIHRAAPAVAGAQALLPRAVAYARFYVGAGRALHRLARAGDVVVVKTDPPMLSAVAVPVAKARGARVAVWLQDVFPEVAREFGVPGMNGPVGAALGRTRNRSLRKADAVVAVCERMRARVASLASLPPHKLHVVHNWADGSAIRPMATEAIGLRRDWGLEGRLVVEYSGNFGRVHEFDTLLGAAAALRARDDIRFLLIGRGTHWEPVRARVERDRLPNVVFVPHQPRARLAEALGAADIHLVVLRPEFEGLVHPSKLYGIMAAGRPAIFVGDITGETARILAEARAGVSVSTGDAAGLAAAIAKLGADAPTRSEMGANARGEFERRYDMAIAFAGWEKVLGL